MISSQVTSIRFLHLQDQKVTWTKKNIASLEGAERKASMPDFHQRTAERLFDMCCANRGTYIKVGQHVGAMEYLLPEQYITVFKELHSRYSAKWILLIKRHCTKRFIFIWWRELSTVLNVHLDHSVLLRPQPNLSSIFSILKLIGDKNCRGLAGWSFSIII